MNRKGLLLLFIVTMFFCSLYAIEEGAFLLGINAKNVKPTCLLGSHNCDDIG